LQGGWAWTRWTSGVDDKQWGWTVIWGSTDCI
jgi:hypothetical protein